MGLVLICVLWCFDWFGLVIWWGVSGCGCFVYLRATVMFRFGLIAGYSLSVSLMVLLFGVLWLVLFGCFALIVLYTFFD